MKGSGIYRRTAAVFTAIFCMAAVFTGCGSAEKETEDLEAYQEYVVGIMDTNYLGQYEKYMEITASTQAEAEQIYTANVQDFALEMEAALSVKTDVVTRSVTEQFIEAAKKLYGQTKYQAIEVVKGEDTCSVSLEVEPVDFRETVGPAFQSAVDSFNEQAKNGDFDKYTDQEYEEAYGQAVADALVHNMGEIVYRDKMTVKVVLDYDEDNNIYFISDEQMEALDGKVVENVR